MPRTVTAAEQRLLAAQSADAMRNFGAAIALHHHASGDPSLRRDISRFLSSAVPSVLKPSSQVGARLLERTTTARFLEGQGFSPAFLQQYIRPISEALWDASEVDDGSCFDAFPVTTVMRLWKQKLLLDVLDTAPPSRL